jgi:putative endonuclease
MATLRLLMAPCWVYILQSESSGRFYCGQTGDLNRRLRQHNDPHYVFSKSTKRFQGPWKLLWDQECPERSSAMRLERRIKQRGIGRFLEKAKPAESRPWGD